MQAHAFPLARPQTTRLVPDGVRHAQPAEAEHQAHPVQSPLFVCRQPEPHTGSIAEFGHGSCVAERIRGFQVYKVGHRHQRIIDLVGDERYAERRLRPDHRLPGRCGVQLSKDRLGVGTQDLRQTRVKLRPGPVLRQRDSSGDSANPVSHLDELGQLSQTRRHRDFVALQLAGPPVAVPLLVGRPDGLLHGVGQSELLRQ